MSKPTLTDAQRFAEYQSVITRLLAIDSFQKSDAFKNLPNGKKAFIGHIVNDLVRDGMTFREGKVSVLITKSLWSLPTIGTLNYQINGAGRQ